MFREGVYAPAAQTALVPAWPLSMRPPTEAPPAKAPTYVELAITSCFSFLQGASRPEELTGTAIALGYAGFAITDINTLAGVVRPYSLIKSLRKEAEEKGLVFWL